MDTIKKVITKPHIYIVIILIGVLLKFYGLESKFFWLDEIYTIFHASGIPTSEFLQQFPSDEIVNVTKYNEILDLNSGQYTLVSQLKGQSRMIQLSPLHYVFLAFWQNLFGADQIDYRLFSLLLFMLTLPLIYVTTNKITRSKLTALIATGFYSLSPYVHLFAQEARYYTLWIFSIILTHYLLLRALEDKNNKWWVFYSISALFTLYVSTLSGVILIGHVIYVWLFSKKFRFKHIISTAIPLLVYLPWLLAIVKNRNEIFYSLSWQNGDLNLWQIILGPWLGLAHIFSFTENFFGYFDWMILKNPASDLIGALIIHSILVIFIVAVIVYMFKKIDGKKFWFLMLTVLPGILFFIIYDLIGGKFISISWRYHIMNYFGIIVIISIFLEYKFLKGKVSYFFLYIGLASIAIISSIKISADDYFYGVSDLKMKDVAAKIFSNSDYPLIITDCSTNLELMGFLETIGRCHSDKIDILYITEYNSIRNVFNENEYSDIFIYQSSNRLLQSIFEQFKENSSFSGIVTPVLFDNYLRDLKSDESIDINNYHIDLNATVLPTSTITFIIKPEILPPDSKIYITGNDPAIGNWSPNQVVLKKRDDGSWMGQYEIMNGVFLEYKFTLGDWDSEFASKSGQGFPNQRLNVQQDTTIYVLIENWKGIKK